MDAFHVKCAPFSLSAAKPHVARRIDTPVRNYEGSLCQSDHVEQAAVLTFSTSRGALCFTSVSTFTRSVFSICALDKKGNLSIARRCEHSGHGANPQRSSGSV